MLAAGWSAPYRSLTSLTDRVAVVRKGSLFVITKFSCPGRTFFRGTLILCTHSQNCVQMHTQTSGLSCCPVQKSVYWKLSVSYVTFVQGGPELWMWTELLLATDAASRSHSLSSQQQGARIPDAACDVHGH